MCSALLAEPLRSASERNYRRIVLLTKADLDVARKVTYDWSFQLVPVSRSRKSCRAASDGCAFGSSVSKPASTPRIPVSQSAADGRCPFHESRAASVSDAGLVSSLELRQRLAPPTLDLSVILVYVRHGKPLLINLRVSAVPPHPSERRSANRARNSSSRTEVFLEIDQFEKQALSFLPPR